MLSVLAALAACQAVLLLAAPCLAQDVNGTIGDDTLIVNSGETVDNVHGLAGNDTITNNGIVNIDLNGGDGADTIYNYWGVFGDILGGDGADYIYIGDMAGAMSDVDGGAGNDYIVNYGYVDGIIKGNTGDDTIINNGDWDDGNGVYAIEGGSGADTITNNGYVDDYIVGGDDNDVIVNNGCVYWSGIHGWDGDDLIINNGQYDDDNGAAYLYGGNGDDTIINTGYVDMDIYGGNGTDVIRNIGLGDVLWITGDEGDDTIVHSGYYAEEIYGDEGDDHITIMSDVDSAVYGDSGAGNIGGTNDTLVIHGGVSVGDNIGEFENVTKLGAGVVSTDNFQLNNADFSVDMYEAESQFVCTTVVGQGTDLDVSVKGGYWYDGKVVNLFSTGAVTFSGAETIADSSDMLTFTIANAQITATRVGTYLEYVDTGDANAMRLARLLDIRVNQAYGDLGDLFAALDFLSPSEITGALRQLGPEMSGAMLGQGTLSANLLWSALNGRPSLGGGGGSTGLTLRVTGGGGLSGTSDMAALNQFRQGIGQVLGGDSAPSEALEQTLQQGRVVGLSTVQGGAFDPFAAQDGGQTDGPMLSLAGQDFAAWARVVMSHDSETGHDSYAGWQSTSMGVAGGVDMRVNEQWQAGLHAAVINSSLWMDDAAGSSADGYTLHLGASAAYEDGPLSVDGSLGWFRSQWRSSRRMNFGNLDRTAEADVTVNGLALTVTGQWAFQLDNWEVAPLAGLDVVYQNQAPYMEHGAGGLDLRVDGVDAASLRTRLGCRVSADLEVDSAGGSVPLKPELTVQWRHEFLDNEQDVRSHFRGGGGFGHRTADPERDALLLGAGLAIGRQDSPSLNFQGGAEFTEHSTGFSASVGFRIPF